MKAKDKEKGKRIKLSFLTYFDGTYEIDSVENTSDTYTMGVCKLEYEKNILTVHLRRPGLLIGKKGSTIDGLSEYLKCKIHIVEVDLLD